MKNEIIAKLAQVGISPVGIYATMPQIIEDAIDTIKTFGIEHWEKQTSTGPAVKKVILSLL